MPDLCRLCIPLACTYLNLPSSDSSIRFIANETVLEASGEFTNCGSLYSAIPSIRADFPDVEIKVSRDSDDVISVLLQGTPAQVEKARCRVLRAYNHVLLGSIAVARNLTDDAEFNKQLEAIAEYCGVAIYLSDQVLRFSKILAMNSSKTSKVENVHSSADTAPCLSYIYLVGTSDAVRFAHTKVNVLLDVMEGKFVDSIEIDLSLQPLVCGPHSQDNLSNILQQTMCSVYLPDWLPDLMADSAKRSRDVNLLFITGKEANVMLTKAFLRKVLRKTSSLYKDCVLSFAKLDSIILFQSEQLRQIMKRYGVFIQLPFLGATRSVVRIQGVSTRLIEQALCELHELAAGFYYAEWTAKSITPPAAGKEEEFTAEVISKMAESCRCAVSTNGTTRVELLGTKDSIKEGLQLLGKEEGTFRFILEAASSHQDFLAGKKNGKMSKIMSTNNCYIRFLPFTEHSFFVELAAENYKRAMVALNMLEEEMPAETTLFVPFAYHKQVIGTGGATIQHIMKKHNVFIQFLSSVGNNFALNNAFSFYQYDNAIIRCPVKNARNMPLAKRDLIDLVNQMTDSQTSTIMRLPRSHIRLLLSEHCQAICEVERKTMTAIYFLREQVDIRGPGDASDEAAQLLRGFLPRDYEFRVAYDTRFADLVGDNVEEFVRRIIVPFRIALNVEIQVYTNPKTQDAPYHSIVVSYLKENRHVPNEVVQVLTAYLREKKLNIIERATINSDLVISSSLGKRTRHGSERVAACA